VTSCFPRAAWAAFLVTLLIPQFASAGPIGWGYTARFEGDENPDLIYLGTHARPDATEPDGFRHGIIYGTLITPNGSGAYSGPARFRIGQLSNSGVGVLWYDGGSPPPGGLSIGFRADLAVRDTATGQTGVFTVYGSGGITNDPMMSSFAVSLSLDGNADQEQVIGGSRYRVHFDAVADPDGGAGVVADVQPVAATPEPGTLALAGLGLGVIGSRLRRKRSRSRLRRAGEAASGWRITPVSSGSGRT
jgi:hypothetical protein